MENIFLNEVLNNLQTSFPEIQTSEDQFGMVNLLVSKSDIFISAAFGLFDFQYFD